MGGSSRKFKLGSIRRLPVGGCAGKSALIMGQEPKAGPKPIEEEKILGLGWIEAWKGAHSHCHHNLLSSA